MPIIRTNIGTSASDGLINIGAAGIKGSAKAATGNMIMNQGLAQLEVGKPAETNSLANKALADATLEYQKRAQERLSNRVDQNGNPTHGTLTADLSRLADDVGNEVASNLSDSKAARAFKDRWVTYSTKQKIASLSQARQQQLDFTRTSVQENIQKIQQAAVYDEPSMLRGHENSISSMLDEAAATGAITAQQASNMKLSAIENMRIESARKMSREDPMSMQDAINKGDTFGLSAPRLAQLKQETDIRVREQEREALRIDKAAEAAQDKEAQLRMSELRLGMENNEVSEADIVSDNSLSGVQKFRLQTELVKQNKRRDKQTESYRGISLALKEGTGVRDFPPQQISNHYKDQVKSLMDANGQVTLSQKAQLAVEYKVPVPAFTAELDTQFLNAEIGDSQDALNAYRFIEQNNPETLSKMNKNAAAIAATASHMVENTSSSPEDAMRIARETILTTDQNVLQQRRDDINKIKEFSSSRDNIEKLESTMKEMLDADSVFGFGGEEVSEGVRNRVSRLLKEAYLRVGNIESAKAIVKADINAVMGETEFNGGDIVMFMAPEKMFPELPSKFLQQKLDNDIAELGKESGSISIRSDDLTRLDADNVSYQLYEVKEVNGTLVELPVRNKDGEIQRWILNRKELHGEYNDSIEEQKLQSIQEAADKRALQGAEKGISMKRNVPIVRKQVSAAIDSAAEEVGIDRDVLAAIAKVESGFNPSAKARTSSASGLFQFVNGTWKAMVNKYGDADNRDYSNRFDAEANAVMGARFTKDNARVLKQSLGRAPNLREVYLAHFSGVTRAISVIKAIEAAPGSQASTIFSPRERKANKGIIHGTIEDTFKRLTEKVVRANLGRNPEVDL